MTKRERERRDKVLAELREDRDALRRHDQEGARMRKQRNRRILRAARYAKPGVIGKAAGVSQAFASRVIREQGKTTSGSVMERRRQSGGKPSGP